MNFNFLKLLDKGSFSEVYLLKEATTNHLYAGKLIKTHKLNQKEFSLFQNEKKILRSFVSNPNRNIIALYKVFRFEGIGNELLVLEYCNGGSLHNCLNNYIIKNGKPFPEDLVRYLMKQILNGVKSLHERGIIHRDLKLNNILLKYNNTNDLINQNIYAAEIKIIDFNTSYCPDIYGPKTILGTVPNMAPSIINNAFGFENIKIYDEKIDIWSLGTLCYEMLFGKPLFGNIQNYEMIQNILSCNFYIPKTISSQARSFLYSMLQKHGINRLSAAQLLIHDFIKNKNSDKLENINYDFNNYHDNIKTLNNSWQNINNNNYDKQKTNIIFNDYDNTKTVIIAYTSETLDNVIKKYLCRINRQDIINNYKTKIKFRAEGKYLNSSFYKTIKEMNLMNKMILVDYSFNYY